MKYIAKEEILLFLLFIVSYKLYRVFCFKIAITFLGKIFFIFSKFLGFAQVSDIDEQINNSILT